MLTVITPATNFRLTTVENLKVDLGILASDTSNDTALGRAIDQASASIAGYCSRVFAAETVREVIEPRCWSQAIMLERYPVITFTSMTIAADTITVAEIEKDVEGPFIWLLDADSPTARTPWDAGRAVVTYRGGYLLPGDAPAAGTPALPADLERAALMLATRFRHSAGRDESVRALTYSDGSRFDYGMQASSSSSGGMPGDIAMLINRFRRPSI